ncbi:MAG: hypothetical protein KAW92_09070 [Candidatus Cloacimonetes bacterium]|nr:hypothetical protein [Candidatus Cloacimonadota bacterium]
MFNPENFIKNARALIGHIDKSKKSKFGLVDGYTRTYFVYNYIKVKRERKDSFLFVEFHDDRLDKKEKHFEEFRKIFGIRIDKARYRNIARELINKPISQNIKKFISQDDKWIAVWDRRINIVGFYQFNISEDGEKVFCHFRTLYPFVRSLEVTPRILGKNWEFMNKNIW